MLLGGLETFSQTSHLLTHLQRKKRMRERGTRMCTMKDVVYSLEDIFTLHWLGGYIYIAVGGGDEMGTGY